MDGLRVIPNPAGEDYVVYTSAAVAAADPDAALVMEGDWGGQIYLACPLRVVRANERTLKRLLADLDHIAWESNGGEGAEMRYERLPVGAVVDGGMGGGLVSEDIWIHEEFSDLDLAEAIREVIRGARTELPT
jgi:hypothetical protein